MRCCKRANGPAPILSRLRGLFSRFLLTDLVGFIELVEAA